METTNLRLTDEQKNFLIEQGLVYDYDNISDDYFCDFVDELGDIASLRGLNDDYTENETGKQALDILCWVAQF